MKVVMIGGKARPEDMLPEYAEEGWEFWGLNAVRPPWTADIPWARWFNLHRFEHLVRDWSDGLRAEIKWAKENPKVPFYVLDSWQGELPNEVIWPRQELASLKGYTVHEYHAGSFDWMVAFAVHLGATEIDIHGCTVGTDSPRDEPISARACLEYWIGFAAGRGIRVNIAPSTDIMWQYHLVRSDTVYGYDDVQLIENRFTHHEEPRK